MAYITYVHSFWWYNLHTMVESSGETNKLIDRPDWQSQGMCATDGKMTYLFFPDGGKTAVREQTELAKQICSVCPVINSCLEYALENRIDHGIWGGVDEKERRRVLKRRRSA